MGTVLACKPVEGAKKLLVSQIQVGDQVRQIVSGIAAQYTPEDMVGRRVIVVTNLKPVKLRGVLSEGMVLCADDGKGGFCLLTPEREVPSGSEVS